MNFKLWLEEKLDERKIRKMILRRLGYNPRHALDDSSVNTTKISSIKTKLLKALDTIGLEEEDAEKLKNWIKTYPESTLQDLLNQIDPKDITNKKEISSKLPGEKAILPKGMPQQREPQDQMMMGNPPKQPSMQIPY